jgi:hypothetical protein
MLISIPDHYRDTIACAMVERAGQVIESDKMVPAFLFQLADTWGRGINYGTSDTFWQAVAAHYPGTRDMLKERGLLT